MTFMWGKTILKIKWQEVLVIYGVGLILTFLATKFPNLLRAISVLLFEFKIPFNWNHGIALFTAAFIGYKAFKTIRKTTFFGNNKLRSLLFSTILLVAYSVVGISNRYGFNPHIWGFLFVLLTLIYDIFEESFWRGYLRDLLGRINLILKYTITGILWSFWHFLIFDNFNQFGGFHVYLLLSIVASFLIGYATTKTNSILVASSVHALLITKSFEVTIFCLVIWVIMIITWDKKLPKRSVKSEVEQEFN